jgi:hypothetical protein
MTRMTLQHRWQRYFTAHGYKPITARTSKYIVMAKYAGRDSRYVFLGSAGAVRTAKTAHITESIGMLYPEVYKRRLAQWEAQQGLDN